MSTNSTQRHVEINDLKSFMAQHTAPVYVYLKRSLPIRKLLNGMCICYPKTSFRAVLTKSQRFDSNFAESTLFYSNVFVFSRKIDFSPNLLVSKSNYYQLIYQSEVVFVYFDTCEIGGSAQCATQRAIRAARRI